MNLRLVAELARADPSARLARWQAATEADRLEWFLALLDRCAVQAWTLDETRAALRRGDDLSVAAIEALRAADAFERREV